MLKSKEKLYKEILEKDRQIIEKNETIDRIYTKYLDMKDIVREQEQKIDKAIEYIKEELYEVGGCIHGSDLPHSAIEPILEILGDKEIKEIPQFKGTLEQLDNLTILGDKKNED